MYVSCSTAWNKHSSQLDAVTYISSFVLKSLSAALLVCRVVLLVFHKVLFIIADLSTPKVRGDNSSCKSQLLIPPTGRTRSAKMCQNKTLRPKRNFGKVATVSFVLDFSFTVL